MTGNRQIDQFIRAHRDPSTLPQDRFEWSGGKVRCVLCHADGWGTPSPIGDMVTFTGQKLRWSDRLRPWQIPHLMDHPWPCSCGLSFREFNGLWRHIGADRPVGWGRQGEHAPALVCDLAVAS